MYELGGPDVLSFKDLMLKMLSVIQRKKMIVNIPFGIASIMGGAMGVAKFLTAGLFNPPITRDQVRNLRIDNVVADKAKSLASLGISPVAMDVVLPEYLWRFRPSGQYAEIKDSAKNLKA